MNTTHTFSADIKQLLDLIVNSFYSNKNIFLRELLSNSSDALDKFRILQLQNMANDQNNSNLCDLKIRIVPDKNNKTLTIYDSGIGMNYDDLITNLGTIAKSGTKSFLESIKNKDNNLIGQFGVGFYSVFLVANKVEVSSKCSKNEKTYKWICDMGDDSYNICESDDVLLNDNNGTKLFCYLKEYQLEF